ncbi:hypothetical protein A3A67_02450 [Candidatus Peribacteria bacterium RIFCSPLOWO2_01_FULL_51_18]|nr:MAG: hypothetical protein A3C52_04850 [Candidatus Peribacteria bacterium RIFCSPHIGHO2_02_FULL_51_15]OGJ66874.1 MAG: hypothetical protein A3A67_02450 [Candidatus Peribacteria bacterium RIFCSPLOWO2_01_FULL_51_18]OGJ68586.1 MAG: hypothetical protein A3J34_04285 [Candidatus Peribacteria bacterium RIFCSPLOWO2_02_FULL_51_10]
MTNTQTNDDDSKIDFDLLVPPPPEFPDPEEIYERLMRKIDPRFAPSNRDKLKEQIMKAIPEERRVIINDYDRAMAEYAKRAEELFSEFKETVTAYRNCVEAASRLIDETKAEAALD